MTRGHNVTVQAEAPTRSAGLLRALAAVLLAAMVVLGLAPTLAWADEPTVKSCGVV